MELNIAKSKEKVLVTTEFRGAQVVFMMRADDARLGHTHALLAKGKYAKGVFTTTDGEEYEVLRDWSCRLVEYAQPVA